MKYIHLALLWVHIAAGAGALVLFWIPVIARKGGPTHVRVGTVYVVLIATAVFTALALSAMMLVDPLAVHPQRGRSPEELARFVHTERVFAFFLAYLAGVILIAGGHGLRVLKKKHEPQSLRTPFDVALNVVVVLLALAMLFVGIRERFVVLAALSSVGLLVGLQNLRYFYRPAKSRMAWRYEHLRSMIPTGIAAYTAFFVFGGRRLFPAFYQTSYYWVFWILPLVSGVTATRLTIRYYRHKFRDNGGSVGLDRAHAKTTAQPY